MGALKGNHAGLLNDIVTHFQAEETYSELSKGHRRLEPRTVSICRNWVGIRPWARLCTLIRVTATRTLLKGHHEIVGPLETRYYISSLRVVPLPQLWAIARNLALNLYRDLGLNNMAWPQTIEIFLE